MADGRRNFEGCELSEGETTVHHGHMAPTWDCCTGRNDLLPGRNVGTEFAFQKCWKNQTRDQPKKQPNMF